MHLLWYQGMSSIRNTKLLMLDHASPGQALARMLHISEILVPADEDKTHRDVDHL